MKLKSFYFGKLMRLDLISIIIIIHRIECYTLAVDSEASGKKKVKKKKTTENIKEYSVSWEVNTFPSCCYSVSPFIQN